MCPVKDAHMSWSAPYCWVICKGRRFNLASNTNQRALCYFHAWKGVETRVCKEKREPELQPLWQARKVLIYVKGCVSMTQTSLRRQLLHCCTEDLRILSAEIISHISIFLVFEKNHTVSEPVNICWVNNKYKINMIWQIVYIRIHEIIECIDE